MNLRDFVTRRRGLEARLIAQAEELATCTTAAMRKCVGESLDDTRRQLRELGEVTCVQRIRS